MNHRTLPRFWQLYEQLPKETRELADKNFKLLKTNSHHPSLHLKRWAGQNSCGLFVLALAIVHWGEISPMVFCGFGLAHTRIMTNCSVNFAGLCHMNPYA